MGVCHKIFGVTKNHSQDSSFHFSDIFCHSCSKSEEMADFDSTVHVVDIGIKKTAHLPEIESMPSYKSLKMYSFAQ